MFWSDNDIKLGCHRYCNRGSYRNQQCAVKLIYTMDLTVDVIQRVAAEASILSSLQVCISLDYAVACVISIIVAASKCCPHIGSLRVASIVSYSSTHMSICWTIVSQLSVHRVCVLLELCSFGSLSDIIRGYGFNWNTSHKRPPSLSAIDKLYLALGCARCGIILLCDKREKFLYKYCIPCVFCRGLAAVHALNPTLCHRDVKSFNFLGK